MSDMISCINCNSAAAIRQGNTMTCTKCGHIWTIADEQANRIYIENALRRAPLEPFSEEEIAEQQTNTGFTPETPIVSPTLEALTVDQLKALAEAQGIDLRGARVKADILMVLADAGVEIPGETAPEPTEE